MPGSGPTAGCSAGRRDGSLARCAAASIGESMGAHSDGIEPNGGDERDDPNTRRRRPSSRHAPRRGSPSSRRPHCRRLPCRPLPRRCLPCRRLPRRLPRRRAACVCRPAPAGAAVVGSSTWRVGRLRPAGALQLLRRFTGRLLEASAFAGRSGGPVREAVDTALGAANVAPRLAAWRRRGVTPQQRPSDGGRSFTLPVGARATRVRNGHA